MDNKIRDVDVSGRNVMSVPPDQFPAKPLPAQPPKASALERPTAFTFSTNIINTDGSRCAESASLPVCQPALLPVCSDWI